MNYVALSAQGWAGARVGSTFTVTDDDQPIDVDDGLFSTFQVPDGVSSLKIVATPMSPSFWPSEATFSVAADGTITSDDATAGSVSSLGIAGARLSVLTVRVWRLRDVSQKVADLLDPSNRPQVRDHKPAPDLHMGEGSDWPPASWTIFARDGIRFIDPAQPVAAKRINTKAPKSVAFDGETIVLELAGVRAPRLLSVCWPASLDRVAGASPTPFLLYFRPGVGQNVPDGYYVNPELPDYPFNHDYAYYGQYQYLWYSADPLTVTPSPKGLPHQVTEAGKKVVTVLPCNAAGREFGAFLDARTIREVLLEIQAFMFAQATAATPPQTIGRLAFGAFSSGNAFLASVLASPTNRADALLTDALREVYFFDPPGYLVASSLAAASTWAGAAGDGRRIAIYNQFAHEAHAKLLGVKTLPASPFVTATANGARTVGVLDVPTWRRSMEALVGAPQPSLDWSYAHHLIPSIFLVHALATSGF